MPGDFICFEKGKLGHLANKIEEFSQPRDNPSGNLMFTPSNNNSLMTDEIQNTSQRNEANVIKSIVDKFNEEVEFPTFNCFSKGIKINTS